MRKKLGALLLAIFMLSGVVFHSCEQLDSDDVNKIVTTAIDILDDKDERTALFGWEKSEEELGDIESDITFGSSYGSGDSPSRIDFADKFPPIGDQGKYGTCVTWAVGYNLKSYLDAKDNNYIPNSKDRQYSAKDLFWAIDNSKKGDDCNGTNFEPALDKLVARGIADLSAVPYEELGDCSSNPPSGWQENANDHQIENYRKIDIEIPTFKQYLSNKQPVVIGVKLGDRFMSWDNAEVYDSDTYTDPGMKHAYHAMIISGYDDDKGTNGAFRVRNEWTSAWGDDGSIWIDYDFMVNKFCFAAFIGKNTASSDPDENNDNEVDTVTTGEDLTAWELKDEDYDVEGDPDSDDPRWRTATYNVFNSGDTKISAESQWNILLLYYDAYDAEEYEIILFDKYTNEYGSPGENNSYDSIDTNPPDHGQMDSWWNNVDVPSGKSVAATVYDEKGAKFEWPYRMPDVTGEYYLVIMADGFDAINEVDEENNTYVLTDKNGDPLYYENGVLQSELPAAKKHAKKPGKYADSPSPSARNKNNVNAYTPGEIKKMLLHHKQTGELREKVKSYMKSKNKTKTKRN